MKKLWNFIIILAIIVIIAIGFMLDNRGTIINNNASTKSNNRFSIISSTENKDLEPMLREYAKQNNIILEIDYAGTIDIMEKINQGNEYDAVFCSNSIWLYMLKDKSSIKNSKSISINPVTFGIKKSKAQELGFDKSEVATQDIVNAIKER